METPHKCTTCGKVFKFKCYLTRHTRVHTGERPYQCTICYKLFKESSNLSNHMKTHSEEAPHKCTMCEKAFKLNSDLTRHIMVHSGERPFSCSICKRAFTKNSSLKSHMRTHSEETPFVCMTNAEKCSYPFSSCEKSFKQSSDLSESMITPHSVKTKQSPLSNNTNIHVLHNSGEPYIVRTKTEEDNF